MFGELFDFNCDGSADIFEQALGLSIAASIDAEVGPEPGLGDLDLEAENLEDALFELENKLFDLEACEPEDCTSAAYDRWLQRKEILEEQIAVVSDQIDNLL